jgi:hypothetical protein
MMDEFDVLMEELEVSDTTVLGALFCLENLDMPDEGAPPAATVIRSAAVARIQVENEGDTSPVSVLPYTLSHTPCTNT